ncbi:type II secretion system F family protein [Cryobacterium sp. BB736]|uniref:type II secretion system F family protein n=1 Tax=Cryobacterium sp. BB736 TaxID=2746963 RepID=UPI0018773D40|nr:type II secretion system F family protein [Cryobacterium sp. BB736]
MSGLAGWAVLCGIALGLGLWSLVSLVPRIGRPRLIHRVAPYLIDVSDGARELVARRPANPLPVFGALLEPLSARIRSEAGAATTQLRLRQAGSDLSVESFRARKLAWAVGGAGVGVVIAAAMSRTQTAPVVVSIVIAVLSTVAGYLLRDWLLQRAAKRRMSRIASELPTVLEFLTLSLAAGEGILDSLRRVARAGSGDLSSELGRVVSEVNSGMALSVALNRLVLGIRLPALSRAVDQLVGALERGSPLADVLRAQAQDAREQAKRELIEVAGKKEIAMMVPLVFLIMPITVAFAIFPGVFVLQLGL